jgi:rSAM/selenodomain-associated transferase 1
MPEKSIGLMAKFPRLGEVKTRLAADIGESNALEVYRKLLNNAVRVVCGLDGSSCYRSVFVTPPETTDDFRRMFPDFDAYHPQKGSNLGDRMLEAFSTLLETSEDGCTCLIGADIPGIDESILSEANQLLASNDIVLGPTHDGGYYLIGLKNVIEEPFRGVNWGTRYVLNQTLTIAQRCHLRVGLLPCLRDLDVASDITFFDDYHAFV